MNFRTLLAPLTVIVCAATLQAAPTLMLRTPDVSDTSIVFAHAGDLWVVDQAGGEARRLTTSVGLESDPHFSPDGSMVVFSGQYDGNTDIYVVPVRGGVPQRLTWHPGVDAARGWTADGQRVVFASGRISAPIPYPRFWTVGFDGSLPVALPVPRVFHGQLEATGSRLVYQKIEPWESEFRGYRGGQNNPIRILDLESFEEVNLPWNDSNDQQPVWLDGRIFFLSDRDWATNVWEYDPTTGTLSQRTFTTEYDVKSLESGGGLLVFEMGGSIHTLDPNASAPTAIEISVRGDFPWARPHWEPVSDQLRQPALSPTGQRAVFEARGDIVSVPAKKGDPRNLSSSSGTADRAPAWSPNGRNVSWFSDEDGEYRLIVADQNGENQRTIEVPEPTFYYTPTWSPDSTHLAFTDADRNLFLVEIATGRVSTIDNGGFAHPRRVIAPEWSPDSKWLAYTKRLTNQYGAIMLYSLESGERHQMTDGMADCVAPAWDASGSYLWFLSSTDYGLNVGWLDMSSYQRPLTRALYVAVLAAAEPSPLLPESDEEPGPAAEGESTEEENDRADDETPTVRVDLDGLQRRIVAVDLPPRDISDLKAGSDGTVFFRVSSPEESGTSELHRYSLEDREDTKLLDLVVDYTVSANGEKLLIRVGDRWSIVDSKGTPSFDDGVLSTDDIMVKVDPPAEWRQMFREAWRYQRDFFYVDNVHGLDLDDAWQRYAPWLDHVHHRADLTYLLDILGGETAVGHSFVRGGDLPDVENVPVGLLGADIEPAGGAYRLARIYTGESWNPDLSAPLSGPGIDVREGEYLLAVNGVPLAPPTNPYSLFDRTAGVQTTLTVGDEPDLERGRDVTVVPVASEVELRRAAWVEDNRREVDRLSDGRLAYVWLPNTARRGYANFNRYYFAQQDRQGAIIDERFNQGGSAADYIVDLLARPLLGYFNNPVGDRQPFTNPNAGIWGPKVMIINDAAGSGGDLLPYMFRARGIGPLVGTRTWGGLVGIWDVPLLVDGGGITAPRGGYFNNDGEWDVENIGVAPDIEVEQSPKLVASGHDPQLERAVEEALRRLESEAVALKSQPLDPVRVRRPKR